MPSPAAVWTVEMLYGLPEDGNRYEIIDGELFVTPAPALSHQRLVKRLGRLLDDHVLALHLRAEECNVDADIVRDEHTLVQPDVLVIDWTKSGDLSRWPSMKSLLLAVEVLSPSTAIRDRTTKRALYVAEGVEYWVVDPAARAIERWLPAARKPEILTERLEWRPAGATSSLVIDVAKLFEAPRF